MFLNGQAKDLHSWFKDMDGSFWRVSAKIGKLKYLAFKNQPDKSQNACFNVLLMT